MSEIIIEIPDKMYEDAKSGKDIGESYFITQTIKNGKPYDASGDLISRSALKKRICCDEAIFYDETWEELYDAVIKAIDEAQTIKFPEMITINSLTEQEKQKLIGMIHKTRLQKVNYECTVEKPKGRWVEQEGYDGDSYYECSVCKDAFTLINGTPEDNNYNFCPNCGADLRGDENETDNT